MTSREGASPASEHHCRFALKERARSTAFPASQATPQPGVAATERPRLRLSRSAAGRLGWQVFWLRARSPLRAFPRQVSQWLMRKSSLSTVAGTAQVGRHVRLLGSLFSPVKEHHPRGSKSNSRSGGKTDDQSFGQRRCSHNHSSGRTRMQRSRMRLTRAIMRFMSASRSPVETGSMGS